MARTVDPERHRWRRLQILDAAITAFAERGYDRTTTAAICAAAGVGSGTLFHYFPTKAAIVVGILELDTEELTAFFAAQEGSGAAGLIAYVERAEREAADPRVPGLISAFLSCRDDAFAAAVTANDAVITAGLTALATRAQRDHEIRSDLPPSSIASWVTALVDGFYARLAADAAFTAQQQGPVLRTLVQQLLAGG